MIKCRARKSKTRVKNTAARPRIAAFPSRQRRRWQCTRRRTAQNGAIQSRAADGRERAPASRWKIKQMSKNRKIPPAPFCAPPCDGGALIRTWRHYQHAAPPKAVNAINISLPARNGSRLHCTLYAFSAGVSDCFPRENKNSKSTSLMVLKRAQTDPYSAAATTALAKRKQIFHTIKSTLSVWRWYTFSTLHNFRPKRINPKIVCTVAFLFRPRQGKRDSCTTHESVSFQ